MDLSNYTLKSILGEGGMAIVHLANDHKFHTEVAVKMLKKEFVNNENIRKRFLSEARSMFKMSHPNIIKVSDLIDEGDTVAFVMEYIEGETLKEYIDHKGKLSDEEIKNLFSQMLDAVGYVHEQKLVHRDIKPSNFMLDKNGKIKLMDFGIAKNMDITSSDYTHTGTNQNMGTPMYMSPEQIKSTKDVTLQSDIYSLGVVLWQMATGEKPYSLKTLSNFELQTKIVTEKLPLISSIFNEIIEIATDKDLKNRFNNCKEFSHKFSNAKNKNSEKTFINEDNNSEKTSVETNVDKTVVESDHNSNTIPKAQINIPVTPPKPTGSSPAIYFITGIVLIIVLGVIFTNRTFNSHSPELTMEDDDVFDAPVVEEATWDQELADAGIFAEGNATTGSAENHTTIASTTIVSFYNNSPYTVYLACAFYDRGGWESIGWYEIFPFATADVNFPETIDKNSFYWHVKDEDGEIWSEEDGYFCVSHSDKFHFYKRVNCNDQEGFSKLDLTGFHTKKTLLKRIRW